MPLKKGRIKVRRVHHTYRADGTHEEKILGHSWRQYGWDEEDG